MGDSLKSSDAFNTELYSSSHVDRQLFSKQRLSPDRNIPDDNILDESNDSKFLSGSVHDQIATSPFTYSSEVDFNYLPIITFFSLNIDKPRTSLTNNDTLPPRFTFYSETTGVIRAKQFSELNISMESKSIESILTSGPFWIDICQPTTLEMDEISRLFGLHPLTNEGIFYTH
ncbi:hypothetical protein BC833DRAFT_610030 [Globomyces pollinis-pini]|nr:hypothetical protein BC833DRAFT_610030 [Globomyces pollinis-pini]